MSVLSYTHSAPAAGAAETVFGRVAGFFTTAREIVQEAFALRRAMLKQYGISEE